MRIFQNLASGATLSEERTCPALVVHLLNSTGSILLGSHPTRSALTVEEILCG